MDRIQAREFIDEQIPVALQDMLPETLRVAYATVRVVADKEDFLNTPSAIFGRGHLVAWAADYQIFKLIRSGVWPYDAEWVPFTKPTGVYLRIDTGGAFVTVSQLTEMREGPRFAKFRANAGLANYPLLPFDTFAREAAESDRKHLVVGHGYQDLNFVFIGAPKPNSKLWIDRTENLLKRPPRASEPHAPLDGGPPPDAPSAPEEGADITIDLELAEHLKKKIHGSDDG